MPSSLPWDCQALNEGKGANLRFFPSGGRGVVFLAVCWLKQNATSHSCELINLRQDQPGTLFFLILLLLLLMVLDFALSSPPRPLIQYPYPFRGVIFSCTDCVECASHLRASAPAVTDCQLGDPWDCGWVRLDSELSAVVESAITNAQAACHSHA